MNKSVSADQNREAAPVRCLPVCGIAGILCPARNPATMALPRIGKARIAMLKSAGVAAITRSRAHVWIQSGCGFLCAPAR